MATTLCPTLLRRGLPTIGLALWLAAIVPGVRYLRAFESTPGKSGEAPINWPSHMPLMGDPSLPTLVVALHPHCSCSKATLAELEEATGKFQHPYNAVMLIFRTRGERYEWRQSSLYREAQQVLHASVIMDDDGQLAEKFGAFTSGEVLYYSAPDPDARRRLLFSGGVTSGRGMAGENAGLEALANAANTGTSAPSSKVYGCGLSAFAFAPGKRTNP